MKVDGVGGPAAIYPDEHAMRGRWRVDCIGRMVMRPSDLEIASRSHLKIFKSLLRGKARGAEIDLE
jgi:hypothetical protein